MKLSDYLILHGIGPTDFAHLIKVRSRMTVHRYITGERVPSPIIMARIVRITRGLVTPADFANDNQPFVCPKACPEQDNNPPYPWSRRERQLCERVEERLQKMLRDEPREGDDLSPPLKHAVEVLGERVAMNDSKNRFWLDRRIVSVAQLVIHANDLLEERGEPLIEYPGVNPILN